MFIDVSIKYTQAELKECQELLAYLGKVPQVKAEAEADKLINEANTAKPVTQKVQQAADQNTVVPAQMTSTSATTVQALQEEPKTQKSYTHDEVKAACKKLVNEKGTEVLGEILRQLGYRKLQDVPEGKWPDLVEAVNAR